jgi:hypothetical protein
MTSKMVLGCLVAMIMALSPAVGSAQQAGLQIGVAQPRSPHAAPPPAPAGTHGTFTKVPTLVGPISPRFHHFQAAPPLIPLVPNFPTVFVPNTVLYPGQTFFPPAPVSPSSNIFFPANPIQPNPPFAPVMNPAFPVVGTPRADLIRQFGPPSVTVITSTGETLYFPGGATVIIQNGQVVGPR